MHGDVHRFRSTRGRGHEQSSVRLAVVVQSDVLPLTTWLVAPTSTSARPTDFRPPITVLGRDTRVLVEQTAAVDPSRLGELVGHLTRDELEQVDRSLRLVLAL